MPTTALTVQDGTPVRFTGPFEDLIEKELADPTEVAFVFGTDQPSGPGSTETTYIYGRDPQLVREETPAGPEYFVDVDTTGMAPEGGRAILTGEFFGDDEQQGTLQASGYARVLVLANPVTNPFEG